MQPPVQASSSHLNLQRIENKQQEFMLEFTEQNMMWVSVSDRKSLRCEKNE